VSDGAAIPAPGAIVDRVRAELSRPGTDPLVVVGDVMLDRYVDGSSTRLSPEAPVPVVDVTGESERLGGAANVALGLARLGARVVLVGVVGADDAGRRVRSLLDDVPSIDARLVVDPDRVTTTKERVRVDGRHVIRVDREQTDPPSEATVGAIARMTRGALGTAPVLVVSDYAKGAVDATLLGSLEDRPLTVVDPKHVDVERYTAKAAGRFGGGARTKLDDCRRKQRVVLERLGVDTIDELRARGSAAAAPAVDPTLLDFARRECAEAEKEFLEVAAMVIPEVEPEVEGEDAEVIEAPSSFGDDADDLDLRIEPSAAS